jgi:hypothetical protein
MCYYYAAGAVCNVNARPPLNGRQLMTNAQEKRVSRVAESKGYYLEKVGKGPHHGRFSIVKKDSCSRMPSGIPGCEFAFSLQDADEWLAKIDN